jgi:hypothetical protein
LVEWVWPWIPSHGRCSLIKQSNNRPVIAIAIAILFFSMPGIGNDKSTKERLRGFDVIGGVLSVCWPVPLLFALQEAGVSYDWDSRVIIGTLVTAFVLLGLFIAYEAWASYKTKLDVIFPARFVTNPAPALLLFSMFLLGMYVFRGTRKLWMPDVSNI